MAHLPPPAIALAASHISPGPTRAAVTPSASSPLLPSGPQMRLPASAQSGRAPTAGRAPPDLIRARPGRAPPDLLPSLPGCHQTSPAPPSAPYLYPPQIHLVCHGLQRGAPGLLEEGGRPASAACHEEQSSRHGDAPHPVQQRCAAALAYRPPVRRPRPAGRISATTMGRISPPPHIEAKLLLVFLCPTLVRRCRCAAPLF
ncbi:hypothetical protein SETIT_8G150600v2 [Setaria italica]|uniref:Uncharacterized protein n=1 Tax=Setaria italica TaxID=4555 RepID=A0A368S858_SETIT|nr:hypothetical protein SETIT_8G150600v2 [Setaria italica]